MNEVLLFDSVAFDYGSHQILQSITFKINAGERVLLVGKSGAGKSTLLKLAYFELIPSNGMIEIAGFKMSSKRHDDIAKMRRKIGVVFQDDRLLDERTVFENLAFILEVTNHRSGEIKRRVTEVLSEVGLLHKSKMYPSQLSGGEMQRVGIARAIINNPVLVIADEPTGNLDPETTTEIIDLIKRINAKGTAFLIATHNYAIVKKFDAAILRLKDSRLEEIHESKLT